MTFGLRIRAISLFCILVVTHAQAYGQPFFAEKTTRESVRVTNLAYPPTVAELSQDSGGLRFQLTDQNQLFLVFWSKDASIDDLDYCDGSATCYVNRCTTSGRKQVYWVDRASGKPGVCVSYDSFGAAEGNADSYNPWVGGPSAEKDEGRYVVFESVATNLSGGASGQQIVVHDRKWEEAWLSKANQCPAAPNGDSFISLLTEDGKNILLTSDATNLIDNLTPVCTDGFGVRDVFIRDGSSCKNPGLGECRTSVLYDDYDLHAGSSTVRLLDGDSNNAHMVPDGSLVVFETTATVPIHFLPDVLGFSDIFLSTNNTFSMISQKAVAFVNEVDSSVELINLGGPANGDSNNPQISDDGQLVVFDSSATDLVLTLSNGSLAYQATGGHRQIYLHNRATTVTTMLSLTPAGVAGNGDSRHPFISNDGAYVFFESQATDLVDGFTTAAPFRNIFAVNVESGRISLVTPGTNPSYPAADPRTQRGLDADATITDIDSDGLRVAFETAATNAINGVVDPSGGDQNDKQDVFLAINTCPTDGDEDGVLDCADECPNDASKSRLGDCGCGVAETDSDGDGFADCIDRCVGINDDTDTDSDGTVDCLEECPTDPTKTAAGQCGCLVPEIDANGNGNADCLDPEASFVPRAPRVRISSFADNDRVRVTAPSRFPGANVSYVFVLRNANGDRIRRVVSTSNTINLRVAAGVNYKINYRIVAGTVRTNFSAFREFKR